MDVEQILSFGLVLRRHRIAAGLSQEELAERAYISRRSLSDMERGVPAPSAARDSRAAG